MTIYYLNKREEVSEIDIDEIELAQFERDLDGIYDVWFHSKSELLEYMEE